MHVPLMFIVEWRGFPWAHCLAGKKNLMTARVSMLLKWRASPDMLPFSLCNKKRLAIRHMNRPLFPTTLSVPPTTSGSRSDLSAPPRKGTRCRCYSCDMKHCISSECSRPVSCGVCVSLPNCPRIACNIQCSESGLVSVGLQKLEGLF